MAQMQFGTMTEVFLTRRRRKK